jgi:K+-sensing histidine kinase KdpD
VRVKDKGIGISPENVERIFDPYFRVTDSKSLRCNPNGNGLGLSICKQICASLGGYLQCFSEVDVGTCMVFAMRVNDGEKLKPKQKQEILIDFDLEPFDLSESQNTDAKYSNFAEKPF